MIRVIFFLNKAFNRHNHHDIIMRRLYLKGDCQRAVSHKGHHHGLFAAASIEATYVVILGAEVAYRARRGS